ncbi:MAG: DUF2752 domain-containing protein [Bacteroidota bacterium]
MKAIQKTGNFVIQNLEAFVWLAVIIYFAATPVPSGEHFTICPLSLAGFQHCPGCGLGRSIILLLHGQIAESYRMHHLGLFALTLFVLRIGIVFRNHFRFNKQLRLAQPI